MAFDVVQTRAGETLDRIVHGSRQNKRNLDLGSQFQNFKEKQSFSSIVTRKRQVPRRIDEIRVWRPPAVE